MSVDNWMWDGSSTIGVGLRVDQRGVEGRRQARGPWRGRRRQTRGRTQRRHRLYHVLDTMKVECRVDDPESE